MNALASYHQHKCSKHLCQPHSKLKEFGADRDAQKYVKDLLKKFDHHPLVLHKIAKFQELGSASALPLGKHVLLNQEISMLIFPLQEKERDDPKHLPLSLRAMRNLNQYLRDQGLEPIHTK